MSEVLDTQTWSNLLNAIQDSLWNDISIGELNWDDIRNFFIQNPEEWDNMILSIYDDFHNKNNASDPIFQTCSQIFLEILLSFLLDQTQFDDNQLAKVSDGYLTIIQAIQLNGTDFMQEFKWEKPRPTERIWNKIRGMLNQKAQDMNILSKVNTALETQDVRLVA